jgi:hypothetical protein
LVFESATDLGGQYALLSTEFYYFGENAVPLPPDLAPIVLRKQGHQAQANAEYFEKFLEWLRVLNIEPNKLYGKPHNCLDEGGQFNEVLTEFPQPKQQVGLLP